MANCVTTPDRIIELQGSLFNDSVPVLLEQRAALDARIKAIQDACAHPGVVKTPKASTGNYDPHSDRYWYECKCPVCLKYWTEDQ
jgi:hypothetical protein